MGWGAVFFFFLVLHRVISKNWTKDLLITRNEIVSNYTYYYGNIYMLITIKYRPRNLMRGLLIAVVYLYLLEYLKLPYSYEFCKQNSNHW